MFNVQVPLPERNEVFLMNTFSDAQLLVSTDVTDLLERVGRGDTRYTEEERETLDSLVENGFVVNSRADERAAIGDYFTTIREDRSEMKATVLTTLQCNFACDYCYQGDRDDYNKFASKMSLDTARQTALWIERRLDELRPLKFHLTLFGGEPLLNLPVAYYLADRTQALCAERGITHSVSMITNGLLLTPEVVDRLTSSGLTGVKITLDGDRDTHNRLRPLRGRQGTFDKIVENLRRIAGKVSIVIGGNFDESSWDSYPALLDFLREQEFADSISRINFKPIVREREPEQPKGIIPLTLVSGVNEKLGGTCMTSAGAGGGRSSSTPCDSCHFVDEKMEFLREETRKHGFKTVDGVHMGPCEIHRRHAYTIGPDGALYACPGFTGEASQSTGHIEGHDEVWRQAAAERFERLTAHKESCGDCSFIPVCGGGCSAAAHMELGDMHSPSCHKGSMESALVSLAHRTAASFVETTTSAI
jgi:uncharacterized protein